MNRIKPLLILIACSTLFACESRFPVEKRFWDPEDYKKVWHEIDFKTPKDEQYPRFSDPETAEVVRKIVDEQNYKTILEDPELGLNYRSEVSQEFFQNIKNIAEVYSVTDVQDKYVYAEELAEIRKFFLGFQIVYFRVGNENIASKSDDTNTIRTNEQTIVGNFSGFLEDLRDEKAYGQYAANLADGITIHFFTLIETFPKANYSQMLATAKSMREKVHTPEIKDALSKLIAKLESKQSKPADPV
jgi:hypothetical protein